MKVLMINGSPRANGNTALALEEMKKVFEADGIETEILHIGNKDIRGCIACNSCKKKLSLPIPEREVIHGVNVVPILEPIITPMVCDIFIIPELTKPTSITVTALDD